jgi:hypothetical protein
MSYKVNPVGYSICDEGATISPRKVPSDRTGLLLSRPLRTVRESFQLTQLKPFERLAKRRGDGLERPGCRAVRDR